MKLRTTLIIALASVLGAGIASAQQKGTSPKPATDATKAANRACSNTELQRQAGFRGRARAASSASPTR